MGIMLSVTLVKFLLMIYCRSFTNEIVKAYAQDHFFDVITNVIGLIAALLANYFDDWMDPVGAIIVSEYFPQGFQLLFIALGKDLFACYQIVHELTDMSNSFRGIEAEGNEPKYTHCISSNLIHQALNKFKI